MPPRFTPETLRFLRALKRNNDRDWFRARRDRYDQDVRAPMIDVIEQLALDFRRFAPEMTASPKTSLYRIYRDTRFSDDKSPLKTQISASFRWRGLPKGEGAGLYLEINPGWVWMGGGFYRPEARHLVRIREHISGTYPDIHRLARAGRVQTRRRIARRRPAGADPARVRQGRSRGASISSTGYFLAGCEFPPEFATSPRFYATLVTTFKAIMPLVRFINEPLIEEK